MTIAYLSLGSNIDRRRHISSGIEHLKDKCGALEMSSVYESESVGFDGDKFYNMIVKIECDLTLDELSKCLKKIEDDNGRERVGPRFSSRTLDIDIVLFGTLIGIHNDIELPRPELYYNAFVLLPMAELASDERDPKTGSTFSQLWTKIKPSIESQQKIWKVEFLPSI